MFCDNNVNILYTYMNFGEGCTMYISVVYKHSVHTVYMYMYVSIFEETIFGHFIPQV
jgi:hypothetical protein